MTYWLESESDILRFLRVKRRFAVEKRIARKASNSHSSINPLLVSLGILVMVFIGIGALLTLRSKELALGILILLALLAGGLVLNALVSSPAPTHTTEYEDNPDAVTVIEVLNNLISRLQSGTSLNP